MAKMKKVKKPAKIQDITKPKRKKQGHKLVWLTLIVIAIPCVIVGYVLFTSMGTQNKPVTGNRFGKGDLDPKITKSDIEEITDKLNALGWAENVSVDLKSATLRILVDLPDDGDTEYAHAVLDGCTKAVYEVCPMETYFTNTEEGKMYDLEINVFNFMVDDVHTTEGQVYLMYTKTGAGTPVVDNMTEAKNWEIVSQIKREG